MDDPLYTLGATEQVPLSVAPLGRLDQDPQVFLGASTKKGGEKPLLIPDFVNMGTYDGSTEEEQELGSTLGARIVIRAAKSKPKLENISLSMWVALCTNYLCQGNSGTRPK